MTQLVTTTCNQCDQNDHNRCPAEALARRGFVDNAGDHCYCAYTGHKTPQTSKTAPVIKSMLGKQKEERDVVVNRKIVEEKEVDEE